MQNRCSCLQTYNQGNWINFMFSRNIITTEEAITLPFPVMFSFVFNCMVIKMLWINSMAGQNTSLINGYLHMAQLMPLPLTVSCFSKIQIGLPFGYLLTWVVPDQGSLNVCVTAWLKSMLSDEVCTLLSVIQSYVPSWCYKLLYPFLVQLTEGSCIELMTMVYD